MYTNIPPDRARARSYIDELVGRLKVARPSDLGTLQSHPCVVGHTEEEFILAIDRGLFHTATRRGLFPRFFREVVAVLRYDPVLGSGDLRVFYSGILFLAQEIVSGLNEQYGVYFSVY